METIIAVIIAVIGWIINHILTIRAQNKNFLNNLLNDARIEITKAIRDYQDWLSNVDSKTLNFQFSLISNQYGISVNWNQKILNLLEQLSFNRNGYKWIYYLEEYEILFPETSECRVILLDIQTKITEYLQTFIDEFQLIFDGEDKATAYKKRKESIEKVRNNFSKIYINQLALTEDLRIYFQNICLSSITGNKIPEREPKDSSCPKIVKDKNGKLIIIGK